MCDVAAEKRIFSRGFRRWHDAEFHRRFKGVLGTSTHLSRAQLERLADIWQISEQFRRGVSFACDANDGGLAACRGWSEFSNAALERWCAELLGLSVIVTETSPRLPKPVDPEESLAFDVRR